MPFVRFVAAKDKSVSNVDQRCVLRPSLRHAKFLLLVCLGFRSLYRFL